MRSSICCCASATRAWYGTTPTGVRVPHIQSVPNGLAKYLDLTFIADPTYAVALEIGLAVALVLYIWGCATASVLIYIVAVLVARGTLSNSQGAIQHIGQVVCVVGLGQWLAYVTRWFSGWLPAWAYQGDVRDLAVHFSKEILAGTYIVAACTKFLESGGKWIANSPTLAISIVKANEQEYYNFLSDGSREAGLAIAQWILLHPTLAQPVFAVALLLELSCFAALASRRLAFVIGAGLVVMHVCIQQVMSLSFTCHVLLVGVYFLQLPCLVAAAYRAWLERRAPRFLRRYIDSVAHG